MRKIILLVLMAIGAGFGMSALGAQTTPDGQRKLNVYVKPFENSDPELAKSIRTKLVDALSQHGIALVESDEQAQIVVSGTGLVKTTKRWTIGHRPVPCVRAVMHVVNKNHVTLWNEDISSSRFAVDLSASFIDLVSQKIEAAVALETKRVNSEPMVAERK